MPKILIIEDETDLLLGLRRNLEFEGYQVIQATDGEKGLDLAIREKPDGIILDIMIPKRDGLEVCQDLRARGYSTPILMLTAKSQEMDKVVGLEVGADDYVTKPFGLRELLARLKALLRRAARRAGRPETLQVGRWTVDCSRFEARVGKTVCSLSHYEVDLLALLAQRAGEVVTRNEILNEIWGIEAYPTDRTVDNYIVKLRKKFEKHPRKPRHILTVHGVGYKFVR
ncbi:MAG: response regulator transcription factor [Planctomycetes bacterium]|nr:response regulator transcription factor [Planctomycetota bacterium]